MPVARPDSGDTRVIAHLDLDCFYVQVEQRKRPELRGKPVGVVQYNPWKGGGLIAVSYEARKCGVLRCMRGDDAKKICPDIELVKTPWADGHAPLNWYRDAGTEVVTVLSRAGVCERASIDEVYLDITEAAAARLLKDFPFTIDSLSDEARKTRILGLAEDGEIAMTAADWLCQKDSPRCDALLACGAIIVAELREAVLAETQFTCSAGIGHNKMLAKLTSGMHKPAQQTVIPASYVSTLLASLPLKKIGGLGGKLGKSLQEDLGVKTPGELLPFSQLKLQELYGANTGAWLWHIARGKNGDEVQGRVLTKSHSCSRAFPGPKALTSMTSVMHWLGELSDRLQEQLDLDLEMHNRKAKLLVLHAAVHLRGASQPAKKFSSKSCPLRYGKEKILADVRSLFERGLRDFCPLNKSLSPVKGSGRNSCNWAVTLISIGANDISAIPTGVNSITSFFAAPTHSHLPGRRSRVEHFQVSEEFETGASSRTPSSNDPENMTSFFSDDIINDEVTGILQPCSSEEPASYRNLFAVDDDKNSDADIKCTPAIESISSPVRRKSHFQLFESDSRNSVLNRCIRGDGSGNPCEDLEPTLIQCSPVEHPTSVSSELETCSAININSQHADLKLEDGCRSDVRSNTRELECSREADEKSSRAVQLGLAFASKASTSERQNPPITGTKATLVPKLKELWQRNVATQAQSSVKRGASNWEYKQEEIDEVVLAQLPVEIQQELRSSLKLNRPLRPSKRTSISDFFPSAK
ncbi:hypothetical protein KC19_12G002200 [Ceratodon purpureus]|uniref:DNA polymerase eta n=1 Tax=Ceratodon purpureus TaxID=3225 RepID=A0A8T0G328_CERPU|nr:hypothetical protein KC19_12G002200 [Ceratodon purpureus]